MNPYLLSEQLCMIRGKGNYYQELGIKVPKKSVTNPYKLYLMDNSKSVTNKTLVYEDKDKNKTEIYSPVNESQLKVIQLAIKKSNAIDGSVYYFNVDVIHNKLDVNDFSGTILSIDLNPLKKKYDNPRKFNDFLMNLFRASRNILS